MMQKDLFIIKELYNIIENAKCETFSDVEIVKGLRKIINEKWITIHPHGNVEDENGKKDYRRLKLEDDETPKEAIDRVYKKEDKEKTPYSKQEKLLNKRFDLLQKLKKVKEEENKKFDNLGWGYGMRAYSRLSKMKFSESEKLEKQIKEIEKELGWD